MYLLNDIGFIAHPKTGSQSAAACLMELGFEECGNHHEIREPWLTGLRIIGATVRNPWDTVVSWYFHYHSVIPKFPLFETWFDGWITNTNRLVQQGLFFGLPYATHVLHFENLDADWAAFLKDAGLPHTSLPHRNVGHFRNGRHYREFYDHRRKERVREKFTAIIKQLDYEF